MLGIAKAIPIFLMYGSRVYSNELSQLIMFLLYNSVRVPTSIRRVWRSPPTPTTSRAT